MECYRATIRPVSSFVSPLQSDTFFGAFCWSFKYLYGDEKLEEFLKKNIEEGPQIIFSNAFPAGYLPVPMGIYDTERIDYLKGSKEVAKKSYQANKKYKKCTIVERTAFLKIQQGDWKGYSRFLGKESYLEVNTMHNCVDREDGTVKKNEDAGNLFSNKEYFMEDNSLYDVYILTMLDKKMLEKILKLMLELGIGGNKSTGKGSFNLVFIEEEKDLFQIKDANAFMALSNFIPEKEDPSKGHYKTLTKFGKLDREFAQGEYPYKKPLLYLEAGATFETDHVKKYYGRFIQNISVLSKVVVNACTIAVPIKINEEEK